jgi:DNA-binding CsgD family transcriptional regulator
MQPSTTESRLVRPPRRGREAGSHPSVGEFGFVGRGAALRALAGALSAAREGSGSLVVVRGEPGIGKTRTTCEFAAKARRRGAAVLWATCYEGPAASSYGPWVEALSGYLSAVEPDRLGELVGEWGPVLAELMPALRAVLGPSEMPTPLPPDSARARLFGAVLALLESIPSVPVLVIDDVHWADADSLDLLAYVAARASRLLIVLTFQGPELDLREPLAARLAAVTRRRPSEYLVLDSLTREESAELLRQASGQVLDPGVIDLMYRQSGGNPFFLHELGRQVRRHGPPAKGAGRGGWRLPETIRQAVALRLAGLSAQTRSVLDLASVFTAGFAFDELQLLTGLDEERLLDSLDEALAAELIIPIGGDRYDFAHSLVRDVLYDQFAPSRKTRLHRRLVAVLERLVGDAPERQAELVRQYHASAALPGADRAIPHALEAAKRARAAHAPGEAVTLLRLARDLVPAQDLAVQAQVESELAISEAEAGLLERAPDTLKSALSLLEATGAAGEALAELVFRVVSTLQDAFVMSSEGIDSLVARALAAVGERGTLSWARVKLMERPRERVSSGLIHGLRWLGFDSRAVTIARSEGTEMDYARSLYVAEPWPVDELEALVSRVQGWRDPAARLRGLAVVLTYVTLHNWMTPVAERMCREFEALAVEIRSIPAEAYASAGRATTWALKGEFPRALQAIDQARRLAEDAPSRRTNWALAYVDLVADLTLVHLERDRLRRGEEMRRLAASGPTWWRILYAALAAQTFVRADAPDEARGLLADLLPLLVDTEPQTVTQNGCVAFAGQAIWELADAELAERLLPAAAALIDAGVGDWYMTSNDLTVARLASLLGRRRQAGEHFKRAHIRFADQQLRPLLAIADYDEALARRAAGRADAAALLASAKARLSELGMHGWTGPIHSKRANGKLPAGLTDREAEVLKLVSAGLTNHAIADQLIVSVHTVERHLQNAYRKIGAHNRADAAAFTIRVGL